MKYFDRKIFSWALYDWANSAYATTVIAGFFPLFFKQYWSDSLTHVESTLRLGLANSVASLVIVLLAPVMGAIADRGSYKKRFLLFFTVLGSTMVCGLFLAEQGEWLFAVILYILATIGFSGGVTFCDSLIGNVSNEEQSDQVSAYGYALGYLGGGLMFGFCVVLTQWPDSFGLSDAAEAVKYSFVLVGIWWMLFSVPLFFYVPEPRAAADETGLHSVSAGLRQLVDTFHEIRNLRIVFTFLVGYWFYIDGVDTIVRMAVDYGMSLNFDSGQLIIALLVTQIIGFPSAIVFGIIGNRIGPKAGIMIAIFVYILVTLWASVMSQVWEFYALAVAIGLVQGGIQSLSRSFYFRIIPKNKTAEFYGFYNMLGKFAAVIGPALMGWIGVLTNSPRLSILSIILLFAIGAIFLSRVDIREGQRMSHKLE